MRYFTDSPLERLMMQKPRERRERRPPAPPPRGHPCQDRHYYNGACIGPCYRNLIITPKERKVEKCDL